MITVSKRSCVISSSLVVLSTTVGRGTRRFIARTSQLRAALHGQN
jgi:hypothetical protein